MDLKDKVVITNDDLRMIEEFFNNYNDPKTNNLLLTDRLKEEIAKFRAKGSDYSVEDQKNLTISLVGALHKSTHPLLRDAALKEVMDCVADVWHEGSFHEELEKAISSLPLPPEEEG